MPVRGAFSEWTASVRVVFVLLAGAAAAWVLVAERAMSRLEKSLEENGSLNIEERSLADQSVGASIMPPSIVQIPRFPEIINTGYSAVELKSYDTTRSPTHKPTRSPTHKPTRSPTHKPTRSPTLKPTRSPTLKPTRSPTHKPTRSPTLKPTRYPTLKSTRSPTLKATRSPTLKLTYLTTRRPTESSALYPSAGVPRTVSPSPPVSASRCSRKPVNSKLPFVQNLVMRLDASVGVVQNSRGNISSWNSDINGKTAAFVLAKRRLRGSKSIDGKVPSKARTNCGLPAIRFPCSLSASNVALPQKSGTVFLVISPPRANGDEKSRRIFGRYPNGGIVYASSRQPAFVSEGIHELPASKTDINIYASDDLVLVKLAYSAKPRRVILGINDGSMHPIALGDQVRISRGNLFIGGSNGGCEFSGLISEVLVYRDMLKEADIIDVASHLIEKWALRKQAKLSASAQLPCVSDSDSGYRKAKDVFVWYPSESFAFARQNGQHELETWSEKLAAEKKAIKALQKKMTSAELYPIIEAARKRLIGLRSSLFGPPCAQEESSAIWPKSHSTKYPSHRGHQSAPNAFKTPHAWRKQASSGGKIRCPRPPSNAILDWTPPPHAPFAGRIKWRDAVQESKKKIASFSLGGKALATFLSKISDSAHALRDQLFGNTCDDDAPAKSSSIDCSQPGKSAFDWMPPSSPLISAASLSQWNSATSDASSKLGGFSQGWCSAGEIHK